MMISRRKFLTWLGLAPVAATVAVQAAPEVAKTWGEKVTEYATASGWVGSGQYVSVTGRMWFVDSDITVTGSSSLWASNDAIDVTDTSAVR